jgi:serine/threonine protein kinase
MSANDYKFDCEIGSGAFSTVHKVTRLKDMKSYALKKVPLHSLTAKQLQDSLNEALILSRLDCPNIIAYKDAFIDSEHFCLVLELASEDLRSTIRKHL